MHWKRHLSRCGGTNGPELRAVSSRSPPCSVWHSVLLAIYLSVAPRSYLCFSLRRTSSRNRCRWRAPRILWMSRLRHDYGSVIGLVEVFIRHALMDYLIAHHLLVSIHWPTKLVHNTTNSSRTEKIRRLHESCNWRLWRYRKSERIERLIWIKGWRNWKD